MFEGVAGINVLWRILLGLHLKGDTSAGGRGDGWIRLEVNSWWWTDHIVV